MLIKDVRFYGKPYFFGYVLLFILEAVTVESNESFDAALIVEDDKVSLAMVEALAEKTGLLDVKATFTGNLRRRALAGGECDGLTFSGCGNAGHDGHRTAALAAVQAASYHYQCRPRSMLPRSSRPGGNRLFAEAGARLCSLFLTAVNKALTNVRKDPVKQDDNFFVREQTRCCCVLTSKRYCG